MAILTLIAVTLCLVPVTGAQAAQLSPGDSLPLIRLHDSAGVEVEIDNDATGVIVVEFWASWCLACRTTLPALAQLADRYPHALRVYAIGIDRDPEKSASFEREYLPQRPASMTILRDPGGELLARFGASGMPALYAAEGGLLFFVEAGAKPDFVDRLRALVESKIGHDK